MKDTKYASLLEAIIYASIRPKVEEDNERALAEEMRKSDSLSPESDGTGFSHLYRAMNDGIAYSGVAPDPYVAIQQDEFAEAVRNGDTVVVVSHGWAAPQQWDGAPSECPDRRRVRMTVVVEGVGRFASIIRFLDQPDEQPLAEVEGRGPLRDAIESRFLEVVGQMN